MPHAGRRRGWEDALARRRIELTLATLLISVLLTAVALELGLRIVSRSDVDGNVFVAGLRLRPFRMPVEAARPKVERIQSDGDLYFRYDPDLGWSVRPGTTAEGGFYTTNAQGVRTDSRQLPTSPEPAPGTLRIGLYGDSFTHSSDVPFEDSLAFALQAELSAAGLRSEALNQGTPGYAMDQAYLRWQKEGRPLSPELVVFGFQHSDAKRNLNLIRAIYSPDTGLLLSKPRFLLEGDALRLVNVPALPPGRIPNVLADFDSWELAPYELFYRPENHLARPWYASRLLAFAASGLGTRFTQRRPDVDFFAPGSEPFELAGRIVERFEREVRADGARFVVLHIPTRSPLKRLRRGARLEYQLLLDALVDRYDVVDPTPALLQAAEEHGLDALFAEDSSHFSGIANRAMGEALARHLVEGQPRPM